MPHQPLLLRGADLLQGEGYIRAGVRALAVATGNLRREAAITGLTQDQLVADAKVVHVMTDLTRVHIRQKEITN